MSSGPGLLTGGTGRLGRELRALMPELIAPPRVELDVTRPETISTALDRYRPEVVVHAAAYTDVAGAERERSRCWEVNVQGTRNLVRALAHKPAFLVHISTDYVFEGKTGGYAEDDPPGPPRNYYALSKLVAEELARCVDRHLVIRTSFRAREWPYPTAFSDLYTSQDYVDVIAPQIAQVIRCYSDVGYQTLHIGTERKSAYELARRRNSAVLPGSKRGAAVDLPDDISLDTSRWSRLRDRWGIN